MGRDNINVAGFILGTAAGCLASMAVLYSKRSTPQKHDGTVGEQPVDDGEDECSSPASEEQGKTGCLPGSESTSQKKDHQNISDENISGEDSPKRRQSETSSMSSVFSQRSFAVDDYEAIHLPDHKCYAENPEAGTNCQVITENDWAADDEIIGQSRVFEQEILSKIDTIEDMKIMLRRSAAINALAQALARAKDEKSCFECVSSLIVPLFQIDGCAYGLVKDSETLIFKHITTNGIKFLEKLGMQLDENGSIEQPFHSTAAVVCSETLESIYTPRTAESPYPAQRLTHKFGMNSMLVTPIVVYGNKFAGTINAYMEREDGFSEFDRILMKDVAAMLGASIYDKRLKFASECSSKVAQEILQSMIPPKVISKIGCYWDETTYEYKNRRQSSFLDSECNSVTGSDVPAHQDDLFLSLFENREPNEHVIDLPESPKREGKEKQQLRRSFSRKISMLNEMKRCDSDLEKILLDASTMELETTQKALYAETVPNVCIIFTDIVGFSTISHHTKPIRVMDMLQDLFTRFDVLCDRHGIQKLEAIGDMFICTTAMFDNDSNETGTNAANALNLAKEMIREAQQVLVPNRSKQTVKIRVGIHRGDLTCGVLGERLPKFTVFGSSVNLACRMKQTCPPNRIRVTKAFYEALPEENWQEKEIISVKNMGEVETYVLNPFAM